MAKRGPAAKQPPLEISIPKAILKAARSKVDPKGTNAPGTLIMDRTAGYDYINNDLKTVRQWRNRTDLLRYLAVSQGPISTALHNFIQVANNGYKVFAYSTGDNTFNQEGVNLANALLARLDTLYDYTEGFSDKLSLDSLLETMMHEAVLTDTVACELVLNKLRLPDRAQVIPAETLKWFRDENNPDRSIPKQYQNGEIQPVSLDIATFWVSRMVGDPSALYPRSMLEAAVKLLIYFEEFMDDVRRVVRQSGHARQTVTLDSEKALAMAPRAIRNDTKKMQEWYKSLQTAVQEQLEAIEPEDAVVLFDTAAYDIKSPSFGNKIDYTPMLNMIAGMTAMSMKTPPSVLGMRLDGNQNMASVETLIFLKSAKAIQTPVATVMSRMLTLACRLSGADVYVKFVFDPLDLRPEMELESFYTLQQTRILEQLSYGFLSDEEAAVLLGTGPRQSDAPKLSGTMFSVNKGQNSTLPVNPGDTPAGKASQPDKNIPRKAGGASQ